MRQMKQHILVIDDEAPIRELLHSYFDKHGYNVSTAGSAAEALRVTAENRFDLAILDVVLSDADGLELLANLKQKHPDLPIIMMTGIGFDDELSQEAKQKGAAGFVSKTSPLPKLLEQVQGVIARP